MLNLGKHCRHAQKKGNTYRKNGKCDMWEKLGWVRENIKKHDSKVRSRKNESVPCGKPGVGERKNTPAATAPVTLFEPSLAESESCLAAARRCLRASSGSPSGCNAAPRESSDASSSSAPGDDATLFETKGGGEVTLFETKGGERSDVF